MASISFDGRSLLIDGRREWLTAATIAYSRVAREQWADRLRAAAGAGFNCIVVPAVWAHHEVKKGAIDFTGERDIRAFIQIIGSLGMRCILRPGPFVGDMADLGGMPAYIAGAVEKGADLLARSDAEDEKPVRLRLGLRSGSADFLTGAARWLNAVAEEVKDLQLSASTARGGGGPIIMVQVEHEWFCGHELAGRAYLGELGRFLREGGINVPLINANNMFCAAEGEIEAWSGREDLLAIMRQLRVVRPSQPPFLLDMPWAPAPAWGADRPPAVAASGASPADLQRRFAEALAAGGQWNASNFHAGTRFGFLGGKSADAPGLFAATCASSPGACALDEAGAKTDLYPYLKRLATFSTSFARVFAHLDPADRPAMVAPGSGAPSVAQVRGERGGVCFVFFDAADTQRRTRSVDVLTDTGSRLRFHAGDQHCAWTVLDVHLTGRSLLDYSTFRPFTLCGRTLVVFGPAGERGVVSINGAAFEAEAPSGKTPLFQEHEGIMVVVCDEAQIDATCLEPAGAGAGAVHIGVAGFDASGSPIAHPNFGTRFRVNAEGVIEKIKSVPAAPRTPRAPSLTEWRVASCDDLVAGVAAKYASIPGPAPMDTLGAPYGYGWHRVRFDAHAPAKLKAWFFEMADRAHVYLDGAFLGVVGVGPGADAGPLSIPVSKGPHTLVALIDNLGRPAGGSPMDQRKGLYGRLWDAAPLKNGKPEIELGAPLSPLVWRAPLMGVRESDRTDPRRLVWSFQHRRKTPLFLCVDSFLAPGVVLLNGEPIWWLEPSDWTRVRIGHEQLRTGKNVLEFALLADHAAQGAVDPRDSKGFEKALHAFASTVKLYEAEDCLPAKAEWAFAPWEAPKRDALKPVKAVGVHKDGPAWWACTIKPQPSDRPLYLDCVGLTKGQIFLNGRNLCRYVVATPAGKLVPTQRKYYLPEGWLKIGQANELVIFDEHGAAPTKCRLEYLDA